MKPNPNILRSEVASALDGHGLVDPFLSSEGYGKMKEAIDRLWEEALEPCALQVIQSRTQLAANERSSMSIHYGIPSDLKG
jgi:hypothetical protein